MKAGLRTLVVCLVCCALGLMVSPVAALGEPAAAPSSLESQLVTPESVVEGEERTAAEESKLTSPEAVAAREASRTEFENLNTEQATKIASEAFPAVIDEPSGGPPKLPAGQSITGYVTDYAAQIDLPEGGRGLIEATEPIALETSPGHRTPVNLALSEANGGFEPRTPVVAVRIPKHVSEGVQLADSGVSLTPVNESKAPLGGSEGSIDGASVLYANTQASSDTVIKPTTSGFEADTMLRSMNSPQQIYFSVGLPAGASLVQDSSGAVEIVKEGVAIAVVLPPDAQDAAGTAVPVSMSVKENILALQVEDPPGEYQYPVEVDPEVKGFDGQLITTGGKRTNWEFFTSNGKGEASTNFASSEAGGILKTYGVHEYKERELAYWVYQTRGESKIYEFEGETEGSNKEDRIESIVELQHEGVTEEKELLSNEAKGPVEYLKTALPEPLCPKGKSSCVSSSGNYGNAVHFQQSIVNKPTSKYSFSDELDKGEVYISEPEGFHSTAGYNTSSPEFEVEVENEQKEKHKEKRVNALYGSHSWLSGYAGALQLVAKDKGVGVSATRLEYESAPGKWEQLAEHNYLEEGLCKGVQCYDPEHTEYWTLNKRLPNGEDQIRYRAEEAFGDSTHETESPATEDVTTVKVDYSKPRSIHLSGLPYGNELTERPYSLTASATDGEGSTIASSGVKSIALYIDGKLIGTGGGTGGKEGEEGKCNAAKGECTATAKWTFNGAELGAGHHSIQLVVFDNAGNEGRLPGGGTEISIRHSTPVAMGPGSVDLESGDFSMGASDVALGTGLTVSRNYSSRATEQGDEGPLGPEWDISLGDSESLSELIDGSLLLTTATGNQTIFAAPLAGVKCEATAPFESPPGDSNLKLWCEENKETKVRDAYYLENVADHTQDKFTLPSGGTTEWVPTVQDGTVSTDTVTYKEKTAEGVNEYPVPSKPFGITSGPGGNLWFTESCCETSAIGEITPTGVKKEFGSLPISGPTGITEGADGNVWFVNSNTLKVDKMTPSGHLTEYESPKLGEWGPIAEGPNGDVWFTHRDGSIVKMNTAGESTTYNMPAESAPGDIVAGPEGDMWFINEVCANTNGLICKIGKITMSGEVTEYPVAGLPYGIAVGPNGEKAVWFGMSGPAAKKSHIAKMTTSGAITEYALPAEHYPHQLTTGPDGNVWFTEWFNGRIGKITPSGTTTEYQLPTGSEPWQITAGPDGKLWFTEFGSKQIGTITTSGTITEPTEALAPVPAGVSCKWHEKATEMKPGCRALEFKYATETTATGEAESEWGDYKRRLITVSAVAYNGKEMKETPVAEYRYDKIGRLRAEWDPRTTPSPLKTTYGYDAEGHVTALNPPGQEPWTFTYGTSSGDSGTGRLLKATRAPTTEALWNGEGVANTEAPKITGTPAVGLRLTAGSGKWSGTPLTYGYQWEDCNGAGEGCTAILGATNANYTPGNSDVGHTLAVFVTATSGGGSATATSTATEAVPGTSTKQTVDSGNSLNAVSCIAGSTECAVSDSKGNAFYATNVSTGAAATWNSWSGPAGESPSQAIDCASSALCLLADGKESAGGKLYYATSLGGSWSEAYSPSFGVDTISCASTVFCVDGQDAKGAFSYSTSPASTSWTAESQGSAGMKGVVCLSTSFCAIADTAGNVHVATSKSQIESSSWTSTDVDGSSALNGMACTATTSCVAVDGAGNVLNLTIESSGAATVTKHDIDGTSSFTAITCTGSSTCVATDNTGNVFVSKNAGETWAKQFALGDDLTGVSCASASLCVTVDTTGNVTAFSPTSAGSEGEAKSPGPGMTIDYNVPLEGPNAPAQMGINESTHKPEAEKWGQKEEEDPAEATAIFPPDSPQGWPASSYKRATVYYLDEEGRNVNVAQPSAVENGSVSTTEYNEANDVTRTLTPDDRATALAAGEKSAQVATLLSTYYTYKNKCSRESEFNEERESQEYGSRLCETEGPQHMVKYVEGKEQKEGLARDHVRYFYDEKVPAEGPEKENFTEETFNLLTETQNLTEITNAEGKVEKELEPRTTIMSYSGQSNLGWKLRAPTSVTTAAESEGAKVTRTILYNLQTGQITETRGPKGTSGESAHDAKIIYYSATENKEGYGECGVHPEWTGLVCETLPSKQPPETAGIPRLPTIMTTYNMWDEPEKIEETFGKTATVAEAKRTKTETYDEAGRLKTSETTTTSSKDTALPKVTDEYNAKTGTVEKQSTTIAGKTHTITSKFNTLGEMTEYVDADGNVAKYKYYGAEDDSLLEESSDSSDENKSTQKYTYNETTKSMEKLVDSAAGTFTASYDAEGRLTSEVYPNSMCVNYTNNAVGEATHVEYIKTANCAESKPAVWFSETKVPSVRGEVMSRTSTLASEAYTYDTLGRLTEAQETPAGGYCKTRAYAYDEESNRTKLTKREPNSKKECAIEGGTIEEHTYDEANRLTDSGIEYDPLGNITKLPAADAEGHELKSTFYADNAVATQEQNGTKHEYLLDPTGRVHETVTGAKKIISHYDAPGEAVAWTCEEVSEKCSTATWTRNIPGIDGSLSAVQTNGGQPVLQLHDLDGDIVATAADNTTETKLLSTYNSTEFGVPSSESSPPPFAWLGAADVESSLPSGVITYGATSYVPQTGLALQSEEVEPPGLPDGSGGGAPVCFQASPWNLQGAERVGSEAPGNEAAREHEAFLAATKATSDPTRYWRAWEAKKVGAELEKLLVIHDLVGQLGSLFGSHLAGDILKDLVVWELTGGKVEDWIEDFAEKLTACASELHKHGDAHGGCWTSYEGFIWETDPIPEFLEMPFAAWCEHMTANAGSVSGCNQLLDEKEYEEYERRGGSLEA